MSANDDEVAPFGLRRCGNGFTRVAVPDEEPGRHAGANSLGDERLRNRLATGSHLVDARGEAKPVRQRWGGIDHAHNKQLGVQLRGQLDRPLRRLRRRGPEVGCKQDRADSAAGRRACWFLDPNLGDQSGTNSSMPTILGQRPGMGQ